MTNEEAIQILNLYDLGNVFLDIDGNPISHEKMSSACDMAVKALETVERIDTRKQELEKKLQSSYSNSWAIEHYALVKLLSDAEMIDYKRAFEIACELLNDSWLYGWDREKIFEKMMDEDGVVSSHSYERFILENLDYLTNGGDTQNDE